MKTTFVKKILADGSPCKKCAEVTEKIETGDQMQFIDKIAIADVNDKSSEGMLLAEKHNVDKAPFFIVEQEDGTETVYTIYFKWVKEVVNPLLEAAS